MTSLLLTMALIIGAPAPKEAKSQPLSLLGEWLVSAYIENGENKIDAVGSKLSFSANGKSVMQDKNQKSETVAFTVNTKREPAEFDITMPGDGKKDVIAHGIYKIAGDVLTICFSRQGRPEKFASLAGSENVLITASRIKKGK